MRTQIIHPERLKKILWIDFFMGFSTGVVGLIFSSSVGAFLGLPIDLVFWISLVTFTYSIFALALALQKLTPIQPVSVLIFANWAWTLVSLYFLLVHWNAAFPLGKAFLVLQIFVVGGLAYFEGKQLARLEP